MYHNRRLQTTMIPVFVKVSVHGECEVKNVQGVVSLQVSGFKFVPLKKGSIGY